MHEATVERKNSLLPGRDLWENQTQEGQPSALTSAIDISAIMWGMLSNAISV